MSYSPRDGIRTMGRLVVILDPFHNPIVHRDDAATNRDLDKLVKQMLTDGDLTVADFVDSRNIRFQWQDGRGEVGHGPGPRGKGGQS